MAKMFAPVHLAIFYPHARQLHLWPSLGATLLLAGLSVALLYAAKYRPYLATGWLWYLGTLTPVVGLVQVGNQSMANRYTYLPLVGLLVIVVWGAADLAALWRGGIKAAAAAAAVAIVACSVLAGLQVRRWTNTETLMRHTLAVTDKNYVAYNVLGGFYMEKGKVAAAEESFREALRINPNYDEPHGNLGNLLSAQNRFDEAIQQYQTVLRLKPLDAMAHERIGVALACQGKLVEAEACFRESLRRNPTSARAHSNLAKALCEQGKTAEGLAYYYQALQLRPADSATLNALAWLRATHPTATYRDGGEAVVLARQAVELSQGKEAALLDTLAAAYAEAGRFAEAVETAKQALALSTSRNDTTLVETIRARIKLYEANSPYREGEQRLPAPSGQPYAQRGQRVRIESMKHHRRSKLAENTAEGSAGKAASSGRRHVARADSGRMEFLAAGLIVLAATAAYANSFQGPFIFDDLTDIFDNASLRHLWPIWNVFLVPTSRRNGPAWPAGGVSLAGVELCHRRPDPFPYHLTNLLIHVLAGLTLFGIVRRTLLLPGSGGRFAAAATPLALAAALIWTLHPLQTEAVTYVVQRYESMMGLFFLLALYAAIRCGTSANPGRWAAAAVAAALLGMGCKEVAVSIPIVILLYDRAFLAGSFREALRRRWAMYAGFAAAWVAFAVLFAFSGNRSAWAGYALPVSWFEYAPEPVRRDPALPAALVLAPPARVGLRLAGGSNRGRDPAGRGGHRRPGGGHGLCACPLAEVGFSGGVVLSDPGPHVQHHAAGRSGLRTSHVSAAGGDDDRRGPGRISRGPMAHPPRDHFAGEVAGDRRCSRDVHMYRAGRPHLSAERGISGRPRPLERRRDQGAGKLAGSQQPGHHPGGPRTIRRSPDLLPDGPEHQSPFRQRP